MKRIILKYFTLTGVIRNILFCSILSGILLPRIFSQEKRETYDIHKVQAAFIYNFIDFVKWPDAVIHNSADHLTIGILGDDKFGHAFDEVEGTKVLGKTLTIKRSDRLEDLLNCWILFVASSESHRLETILNRVQGKPILTVSDMDEFTRYGGMIQFYPVEINGETKVRFDVNKQRADLCGLTISYQLLALARPKP